jgi:hypothetical protein
MKDAAVVLKNPKLEGDKLIFNVQTLEGDLAGADSPAAVFIDVIGRPLRRCRLPALLAARHFAAQYMEALPEPRPMVLPPMRRRITAPTRLRPVAITPIRLATNPRLDAGALAQLRFGATAIGGYRQAVRQP